MGIIQDIKREKMVKRIKIILKIIFVCLIFKILFVPFQFINSRYEELSCYRIDRRSEITNRAYVVGKYYVDNCTKHRVDLLHVTVNEVTSKK